MESILWTKKSKKSLLDEGVMMLDRVKQAGYSKWHSIFNKSENKIWFRSDLEKDMKLIDLSLLDFSCKKPNLALPLHQEISNEQDVSYKFSLLSRREDNETIRRVLDIRQSHLIKRFENDLLKENDGDKLTAKQEEMLKEFSAGLMKKCME